MKSLVVYFSAYGTTKAFAEEIAKQTGSDIAEIVPVIPYDCDKEHYNALADYAKKEHDQNIRPEIKNPIDISGYDTVFVGYPMWWYTMPMILYTFFESQNWNGKRVIPFNMHMGSRDGGTYKTVRELAKGAEVLEGLPLSMQTVEGGAFSDQVKNWINGLGL